MDVGAWLHGLGLGQHEPAFRDAAIDASILRELSDEHLKELGLPLGHRLKLLRAIAALGGPPAHDGSGVAPSLAEPLHRAAASIQAERRQLTVMFVDLVGSTALSARLDPEDMQAVLRDYQNAAAGEITRFGGHVARYMGDGVLAFFGWPQAYEDAAERSVRAGLAIAAAVGKLAAAPGEVLAARLGIATGLVVVGDMVGEGPAREEDVVGETPNLAARLQTIALPGTVVVAADTRALLGQTFDLEDLGGHRLRSVLATVRAYRVVGESRIANRFEAHHGAPPLPLVGREHELALLVERWRRAKAGEGQMVLLSGEAGIGKSRLTRALLDVVSSEPHTRVRLQCSPYHSDSALYPVTRQLEVAAGFQPEDGVDARLDRLEQLIVQALADPAPALPLMAALLGLDGTARYGELDITPQQQRNRTLQALIRLLLGLASRQPVLFVVEDAHWIDPSTLEFLNLCLDQIVAARVLLLITARPTFEQGFGGHPIVTRLALHRLGREETAAIVDRLTSGRGPPAEVLDEIAAKTDGVPLFIEELTKTVIEAGSTALEVPASLHDLLMARLDRRPLVKEVAQVAACIGREFDRVLLGAIADMEAARLADGLAELVLAELAFRRGGSADGTYVFKHALVRDAAYASLLRSRRRQIHRRIVVELKLNRAVLLDAQPELLARHCAEADLISEAIDNWRAAGAQAVSRAAMIEAAAHFAAAVGLVPQLPSGLERDRSEVTLQISLAHSLALAHGYTHEPSGIAYRKAVAICRASGLDTELPPSLYGLFVYHLNGAELSEARGLAEEQLARAEASGDPKGLLVGVRAVGTVDMWRGHLAEARLYQERALALFDPNRDRERLGEFQHDVLVSIQSNLAWLLLLLGYPDQASQSSAAAVTAARDLAHPISLAVALHRSCQYRELLRVPVHSFETRLCA